jgi:hypothetical protein
MTGTVERGESREFRVRLPLDVSSARYAAIVHAVAGILDAAGIVAKFSIVVDHAAGDAGVNAAFDHVSAAYPRSDR